MNREHLVAAGLSVWLAGCGAAGPPGPAGPAGPMGSDGSKGDKGDPEVVSPQLSLLSATAGFQDRVMELQLAGTTEAVRSTYRAVLAFAQALLDRKAVAAAATVCAAQLREVGSGAGNLPRATRILVDRVAARCG